MNTYRIQTYSGTDPALNSYKNMIRSFFMKSLRDGNDWFRAIDSNVFYKTYFLVIDLILSRADTIVKLAVLSDDEDVCLGFSIMEGKVLHYVFVKPPYCRQGIGSALVPKPFDCVTHLTKIGKDIRSKKFRKTTFNPFI